MRFDTVTLFPEMVKGAISYGVIGRALERQIAELHIWNPRDYSSDGRVDERPFGGGAGMVMCYQPLKQAIRAAKQSMPDSKIIYLSPQGSKLNQTSVQKIASRDGIILVAGRYQGIDQRLIEAEVDEQWSIGDYILSGGELAALVLMDAVIRLLPGALGNVDSPNSDSFHNGLLAAPQYTRPEIVDGYTVPQVLLSGDHVAIQVWREQQAIGKTWQCRPDLLDLKSLSERWQQRLDEFQALQEKSEK